MMEMRWKAPDYTGDANAQSSPVSPGFPAGFALRDLGICPPNVIMALLCISPAGPTARFLFFKLEKSCG